MTALFREYFAIKSHDAKLVKLQKAEKLHCPKRESKYAFGKSKYYLMKIESSAFLKSLKA